MKSVWGIPKHSQSWNKNFCQQILGKLEINLKIMYPVECVSYKHLIYIKLMKAIFSYIKFLVISFIKSLHTIQILFYNWSHSLYFIMWSINFIFYIFNRLFCSQKCGKLHSMLQISSGKTYKRYCKSHEWYKLQILFLI